MQFGVMMGIGLHSLTGCQKFELSKIQDGGGFYLENQRMSISL